VGGSGVEELVEVVVVTAKPSCSTALTTTTSQIILTPFFSLSLGSLRWL
jgi:hypothetical protein